MMSGNDPILVRRSRKTGHEVLLHDFREEARGRDDMPSWVVYCDAHTISSHYPTRQAAIAGMSSPEEWCSKCRFEVEHGAPGPGEEVCSGCVERLAPTGYPALGRCGPCRGMSEEEGYLKIPGEPGADMALFRDCINDGRLEAHLFRKLWKRVEWGSVEQHYEAINVVVEELAWIVAGDADISKTNVEEYHRMLEAAAEEEGSDD